MSVSKKLVTTLVGGALAATGIATAAPAMAASYFPVSYDASGSTFIGQQVNTTASLGPAKFTGRVDVDTLKVDQGKLPLPPTTVTFPVFGGLSKLRATVNFIQSGDITAQINAATAPSTASATAKYTIKLTNAQAQGPFNTWIPLNVGNNCQTSSPVVLNLKTPPGQEFNLITGGTIAGKYTIGQFQNCNILVFPLLGSVVVNALVPGSNNTATINLSNGQIG